MKGFMEILLNMSLMASIVIFVVIIVRQLFSWLGVPKKYAYLLWILPFIRLVCPWSFESDLSLLPDIGQITEYVANTVDNHNRDEEDMDTAGGTGKSNPKNSINENTMSDLNGTVGGSDLSNQKGIEQDIPMSGQQRDREPVVGDLDTAGGKSNHALWWMLSGIWLTGVVGILFFSIDKYRKLKKRLNVSFLVRDNIYLVDDMETAFVAGYLSPRIYLPAGISEREMEYIIAHEKVHISRKDHWIKTLAFFAVALHWFNPVCWLAFVLMGKDMEMSCDEVVIRTMDREDKKAYANVLLNMAAGKRPLAGVPLTFVEGNAKERIKNVMKDKKPIKIVSVLAVLVIAILAGTLLTNPKAGDEQDVAKQDKAVQNEKEQQTEEQQTEEDNTVTTDQKGQGDSKLGDDGAMQVFSMEAVNPDELPYGEVQITTPIVASWGADDVQLIHANPGYAVAWGDMGLFVYSVKEKRLTGAVNVKAIGCDGTQGDNYTDVFVSDWGRIVYMHPINKDYMFAYNIYENTLEKQEFVDGGDGRPKGFKIIGNRQNMEDILEGQVPDIWISSQCEMFTVNPDEPDEKKYLGYLASGSGEIGALSYVIVEWNETKNGSDPRDGAIWYPFFEGQEDKLLWKYTEDSRMYFAKTADISAKGLTLGLYNLSGQEVTYGEEFHLYSHSDYSDEWKELTNMQDVAFHEIGYPLKHGELVAIPIDWAWIYGELPTDNGPREYRLVKKIHVPRSEEADGDEPLEYTEVELTVEFTFPAS
ncbi:MAG: M56 family metallopeptidase [Lachnospiraceae bacterium]|nr:M56 family metallopeptidase [Lachnospiraceae bacterium]